jgi:hypothetical protein
MTRTDRRLQRLFAGYNRKYFSGVLSRWSARFSDDHPGLYGYCDRKHKHVEIRLSAHCSDRAVRATLVHEMAHAATSNVHGPRWRREMERLRAWGAPTEALDFIVPYTASVRSLITSFIEVAKAGASWEEALAELGDCDEMRSPQVFRQQARKFFASNSRKTRIPS